MLQRDQPYRDANVRTALRTVHSFNLVQDPSSARSDISAYAKYKSEESKSNGAGNGLEQGKESGPEPGIAVAAVSDF